MATRAGSFKAEHPLEKRTEGSAKIRAKYPDRVACIVEAARKDDPVLEQRKFLVPADSTVAKFIFQIRKQMKLDDHENVFVFVGENQQQPIGTALMMDVYKHNKDEDGFLYVTYSAESFFG